MQDRKESLIEFFDAYRDTFNRALQAKSIDAEYSASLYADTFIGANPAGVNCGKNDEQFRDVILNGFALYKSIGIKTMEIVSKEITLLDDFHAMAEIVWESNYVRKDGAPGSVAFKNFYFTQTREGAHKVFAFITGDEQAVLKEIGLI